MPDYHVIYSSQAEDYERLVSREDCQGNILPTLNRIRPLAGLDVVELGAGTGRLTCQLAPQVKTIRAFDASAHMLDLAAAKLETRGLRNWSAGIADHRRLPVPDQTADVAISGWSVCYTVVDYPDNWRHELSSALAEMQRILRPGGTIIILETLGTGHETPLAPAMLTPYYAFLESAGFASTWIRTDYRFESLDEAEALTRFFFGDELAAQVIRQHWVILPECTGVWWRHL
jgi:ubiquinone/menaquinone biosynthesis C-methylase UbiE